MVGLSDTGDDAEAVLLLMRQALENHNRKVQLDELETGNIALVAVTCTLPPFATDGQRLDVEVSSIGDASSLRGGILMQTPLAGADGNIYVVAQGPLSIGGFGESGPGVISTGRNHVNYETAGIIPQGGIVEREVPMTMITKGQLELNLKQPDFTTAHRIASRLVEHYGHERVLAEDAGTVHLVFLQNQLALI